MFVDQLTIEAGAELAQLLVGATAWEVVATVLEDPAATEDTWLHLWRNHTGAVEIERTRHECRLSVPCAALVHPGLDVATAEALAATFATAVSTGAQRAGYSEAFGRLEYVDARFVHVMRRSAR